jgi:hypothetical protein
VTFFAVASGSVNSAAGTPAPDVQAGVLGFLVVAAIGVVLVFLLRSMNKHLRKIGPKPEDDALPEEAAQRDGAPPASQK